MSQVNRLLNVLSDALWHRSDEIMREVVGDDHLGLFRLGARIHDLKAMGALINGRKDEVKQSLYWYQMTKAPVEKLAVSPHTEFKKAGAAQGTLFDMHQNHYD